MFPLHNFQFKINVSIAHFYGNEVDNCGTRSFALNKNH